MTFSFPNFKGHIIMDMEGQWGLCRLGDSGIVVHLLKCAINLYIPLSLFDLYFPIFQVVIALPIS